MTLTDRAKLCPNINNREDFGWLLIERDLVTTAVEVGTDRAWFAEAFLKKWPGKLFCIDNYSPDYEPTDIACVPDRSPCMQEARQRLAKFSQRVEILIEDSLTAADKFEDNSLDFVYVDACHRYESVKQDLNCWWPKVKPGGLLAGHDIVCPGEANGGWGPQVQRAVNEFAAQELRYVWIVKEAYAPYSYYFVK